MNEIDSKNLAPMVFFPMLRNVVSEKEREAVAWSLYSRKARPRKAIVGRA